MHAWVHIALLFMLGGGFATLGWFVIDNDLAGGVFIFAISTFILTYAFVCLCISICSCLSPKSTAVITSYEENDFESVSIEDVEINES